MNIANPLIEIWGSYSSNSSIYGNNIDIIEHDIDYNDNSTAYITGNDYLFMTEEDPTMKT